MIIKAKLRSKIKSFGANVGWSGMFSGIFFLQLKNYLACLQELLYPLVQIKCSHFSVLEAICPVDSFHCSPQWPAVKLDITKADSSNERYVKYNIYNIMYDI